MYEEVYDRWDDQVDVQGNWMAYVLKYAFKTDGFSCGFYVVAVIMEMGSDASAMPLVAYDR